MISYSTTQSLREVPILFRNIVSRDKYYQHPCYFCSGTRGYLLLESRIWIQLTKYAVLLSLKKIRSYDEYSQPSCSGYWGLTHGMTSRVPKFAIGRKVCTDIATVETTIDCPFCRYTLTCYMRINYFVLYHFHKFWLTKPVLFDQHRI
jgi:hypothetical protein